jgi:hypothetical protein
MLLASRAGALLSTLHAAGRSHSAARSRHASGGLCSGSRTSGRSRSHLHLAVVGWLTLLLVTVGRTLGPMLALAPAAPRRRTPLEEVGLTLGLWLLLGGLAAGLRPLELAGGLLALAAVARSAALTAVSAASIASTCQKGRSST